MPPCDHYTINRQNRYKNVFIMRNFYYVTDAWVLRQIDKKLVFIIIIINLLLAFYMEK